MIPERPEAAAEHRAEIVGKLLRLHLGGGLGLARADAAGMPQVDVQLLDLLDQEQDGPAGRAYLVAAVVQQTLAPSPQGLELVFVEPLRRQSLPRFSAGFFMQWPFIRVADV
ncbi:MAG TPA: hypothetical protein VE753_07920 [Gaiellaceae bacterium]|nr:hypothetical protein [Gaiellaceae bacterium]